MTLSSVGDDLVARVEAELKGIFNSRQMPLYQMMSYHMGWSDQHGQPEPHTRKQRPLGVLCLLACRAARGDIDVALPAAAAVELVSGFCEIHDDVQGGKPLRDNRDAVWWVWGPAQAINAGDGMHALARLALFRLQDRGVSPALAFRALQILDESTLQTCEGRFLDLEAQERIDVSVAAYFRMVERKAGALPSCAMRLGALSASEDARVHDALAVCGAKLGVAWQIRAELEELWGKGGEEPSPSAEAMNKKKMLPVVYAMERATREQRRRLGEIYFKRVLQPEDVALLRGLVEELGARYYCEEQAKCYRDEALAALDVPGVLEGGGAEIEGLLDTLLR